MSKIENVLEKCKEHSDAMQKRQIILDKRLKTLRKIIERMKQKKELNELIEELAND